MTEFKHAMGTKVQDRITRYTGIVVARTEWMYGCLRYTVQAQELKDGKPVEAHCFDEDQLELVDQGIINTTTPRGGDRDDVRRVADPSR